MSEDNRKEWRGQERKVKMKPQRWLMGLQMRRNDEISIELGGGSTEGSTAATAMRNEVKAKMSEFGTEAPRRWDSYLKTWAHAFKEMGQRMRE